jgi:hypothetical protein
VIKRFSFGASPADLPGTPSARCPGGPALRAVTCTVIPELSDPGCPHDEITVEWLGPAASFSDSLIFSSSPNSTDVQNFSDSPDFGNLSHSDRSSNFSQSKNVRHLENFTDSPDCGSRGRVPAGHLLAGEHILRGEKWLARRWRDGGDTLKHMALATRATGLTPAEFSRRWRSHSGTARTAVIPGEARGLAYVQNHPVPGDWPYDAVNEVYFDDAHGLKARVAWFRANVPDPADGVLFGQSWLIAVREVIVS